MSVFDEMEFREAVLELSSPPRWADRQGVPPCDTRSLVRGTYIL